MKWKHLKCGQSFIPYDFVFNQNELLYLQYLACTERLLIHCGVLLFILYKWGSGEVKWKCFMEPLSVYYRQVSNIRRTLAGNTFVDHSDVVGASPVGAAPTTSSFLT